MTKAADIVAILNEHFPEKLAVAGDPVGWQLGDQQQEVKRVLTTLDVRPNVVAEAIAKNVDLIVSHHPLIFRPAKNLDLANPQYRMYAELLKAGIGVYAIHTNSDKADNGSSQWEAEDLGLQEIQPFCSDKDGIAIGRQGVLEKALTARQFADYVAQHMGLHYVRLIAGNNEKIVKSVGLVCGDGNKFWPQAVQAGLDAYVTGDVYYHTGHDMIANDLVVVDPGHYTEKIFADRITPMLTAWCQKAKQQVLVIKSEAVTDPFQNIFEWNKKDNF